MKTTRIITAIILLTLLIFTAQSIADVKLPAIIGDNMILQQNKSVPLWGTADPGEKVTVQASWKRFKASTKADKDGKWQVKIKTPKASGPHTITITGNNTITINNILTGEVWLCSGQSNMEWRLKQSNDAEAEIKNANYPDIRLFTVQNTITRTPQSDCIGSWSTCSPETAADFSAVGYFFGRKLHKDLNIPIGLISADWGGTPAEAWTSARTLKDFEDFAPAVEALKDYDPEKEKQQQKQNMIDWDNQLAQKDPGTKEKWQSPALDDSDWKTMDQPAKWSGTELASFDGAVWFRKTTNLPPAWSKSDMTITLGPIDDIDTLYVNGKLIGHTTNWSTPRTYTIPASALKTGKNTIAIRVIDMHGEGGIYGTAAQMNLKPKGAPDKQAVKMNGPWKYKKSAPAADIPPLPAAVQQTFNANTPTSLYNGMIAPLVPFRFAGAIWYQGESNASRAYQYRSLFPAMITDWRKNFGHGDFPFYFVQIAPYNYAPTVPSQELREAQFLTMLNTKNTGMAVTMDIGNVNDIHPRNKQDVGKRLALWALAKDYGQKDIVYSGPVYKSYKIESNKIRLSFDYAQGLKSVNGDLNEFTIAGPDNIFVPANAVIDSKTILVYSKEVTNPVAVRFAWSNTAQPNLFNGADLPASSFRTDDFSSAVIPTSKMDTQWWADRHQQKLARAKQGDVDLLFIGDSITHAWENATAKSTWDKYYANRKPFNIGYSGDRTENVLWRLNNGEIDNISPRVAVLMIGTNNTDGINFPKADSGIEVAQGITQICKTLRRKLPDTKILILSTFPYGQQPNPRRDSINEANKIVSKLKDNKHIFYLNLTQQFLNKDKTMDKEIMPDYLHPSPKGQLIWAKEMEPTLAKLLGEKPVTP